MEIAIHNAQFSYHIGGTERLIFEQIKHLLKYPDVKITLITSKIKVKSLLYREIEKLGVGNLTIHLADFGEEVFKNEFTENSANKWHLESIKFGIKSQKYYKNKKFDLIITHFSTDSLFIPKDTINILHLHGTPLERSDIGQLSILRPDYYVAVSNNVRGGWINLYPELNKNNIEVIYPGVNENFFKPLNLKKDIDILFVGRLIKIKGIDELIKSLNKIKYKFKAVIIGDGPEKMNILNLINNKRLSESVGLISNITDNNLVSYYNRAKIVVLPSFAKEGMVLTMLEAASCECAIITSNCCSMPEFIKDNINGLLTPPKNIEALAMKINSLLIDDSLRLKLGKKAREFIIKDWTTEKRVNQLYDFYKKISSLRNLKGEKDA